MEPTGIKRHNIKQKKNSEKLKIKCIKKWIYKLKRVQKRKVEEKRKERRKGRKGEKKKDVTDEGKAKKEGMKWENEGKWEVR